MYATSRMKSRVNLRAKREHKHNRIENSVDLATDDLFTH